MFTCQGGTILIPHPSLNTATEAPFAVRTTASIITHTKDQITLAFLLSCYVIMSRTITSTSAHTLQCSRTGRIMCALSETPGMVLDPTLFKGTDHARNTPSALPRPSTPKAHSMIASRCITHKFACPIWGQVVGVLGTSHRDVPHLCAAIENCVSCIAVQVQPSFQKSQ